MEKSKYGPSLQKGKKKEAPNNYQALVSINTQKDIEANDKTGYL